MIKIATQPTDKPLFGQSKWWGQPDMPENLEYPEVLMVDDDGEEYMDPLTFICQLRCDELAPYDTEQQLPHIGMLYFFAALDYFLDSNFDCDSPGLGLWQEEYFRVLYSPTCNNLHTHSIVYDDGTPFGLPAEAITFSHSDDDGYGISLLGDPYLDDVCEQFPGMLSLLQIDEEDRWRLRFYDCGMLNFLISPEHLRLRHWNKVQCHLFSF